MATVWLEQMLRELAGIIVPTFPALSLQTALWKYLILSIYNLRV